MSKEKTYTFTKKELKELIRKSLYEVGYNENDMAEAVRYNGTKPPHMIMNECYKKDLDWWLNKNLK